MAATGAEYVTVNQAKILKDAGDKAVVAAVAAEASAREKADQLLETEVEGKLDAADLVAGPNVTITPEPETGHVIIASTGGGGGGSIRYTAGDGIQISGSEIGVLTSNVNTVATGSESGGYINFNMTHQFGPDDGAMQGHSLRADMASFAQSGNTLTLRDGGIATAKIANGAVTAEKIAAGVIPDTSGFITQTTADERYAAVGHTHAAATAGAAGFMSAADKTKLDGLTQYVLPQATSDTLGGVKVAGDEDARAFLGY